MGSYREGRRGLGGVVSTVKAICGRRVEPAQNDDIRHAGFLYRGSVSKKLKFLKNYTRFELEFPEI